MALDPFEGDVTFLVQLDKRFPDVAICHWLLLRVLPAAFDPTLPPVVSETIHDIGGIADNM